MEKIIRVTDFVIGIHFISKDSTSVHHVKVNGDKSDRKLTFSKLQFKIQKYMNDLY